MPRRILEIDQNELMTILLYHIQQDGQGHINYDVIRVVFDNGSVVEITPTKESGSE